LATPRETLSARRQSPESDERHEADEFPVSASASTHFRGFLKAATEALPLDGIDRSVMPPA
jgi:hypothetical protein